jgi:hypothetical protein
MRISHWYLLFIPIIVSIYFFLYRFEGFQTQTEKQSKDINAIMKGSNIIFASTIRNSGNYLKKALDDIDKCGNKFKSYALIIYENDSIDSTRNILQDNKKDNYHYLLEDDVKESRRTVRISNGRNKILDKVKEINRDDSYDYLVLLDLDDINHSGMFATSIDTCFKYDNWDVLTANQSTWYYDLWALRKKDDMEYDCWEKVRENTNIPDAEHVYVHSKFRNYPQGGLLEVDSAFGGAAIFKIRSIPDSCRYNGITSSGFETCEHVAFNRCLKEHGKSIYINTEFITS